MKATPRLRAVILASMSVAGILCAHAMNYWIIVPNGEHRHELLVQSGHGYWPHAGLIALAAGLIAALTALASGIGSDRRAGAIPDIAQLALVQVGGFIALEAVERLGSGPAAGTFLVPLLSVGVAIQVIVAIATVFVLRSLVVVGRRLARAHAWCVPPLRACLVGASRDSRTLRTSRFRSDRSVRAPPATC